MIRGTRKTIATDEAITNENVVETTEEVTETTQEETLEEMKARIKKELEAQLRAELMAELKAETKAKPKVTAADIIGTTTKAIDSAKVYEAGTLVPCRSVTAGELLLPGKSGLLYTWSNYGDITEVEFQDLRALNSRNSAYLTSPLFVIEDDTLLAQPAWTKYASMYSSLNDQEDVTAILDYPLPKFKTTLKQLPAGMRNTIKNVMAESIEQGTFDSIQKIKFVDELLGTELMILVQ